MYRLVRPGVFLNKREDLGIHVDFAGTFQPHYVEQYDLFMFCGGATKAAAGIIKYITHNGKKAVFSADDLTNCLGYDHPNYRVYLAERQYFENALRNASAVFVENKRLEAEFCEFNDAISIVPNMIDEDLWGSEHRESTKAELGLSADTVTVGWFGSNSHRDDLLLLKDVVPALNSLGVKVILGGYDPGIFKQRLFVPFVKFEQLCYMVDLFDIGLAPLRDTRFNSCRSPIKMLEYAMSGIPCVSSPVGPYKEKPVPTFHASTTEEWIKKVMLLVNDNAQGIVLDKHSLQKNVEVIASAIREVVECQ